MLTLIIIIKEAVSYIQRWRENIVYLVNEQRIICNVAHFVYTITQYLPYGGEEGCLPDIVYAKIETIVGRNLYLKIINFKTAHL